MLKKYKKVNIKENIKHLIKIVLLIFLYPPAIVSNTLLPYLSLLLISVGVPHGVKNENSCLIPNSSQTFRK